MIKFNCQEGEKAIETLADFPEESKSALGYSSDEFILDCQYNGYVCNPQGYNTPIFLSAYKFTIVV